MLPGLVRSITLNHDSIGRLFLLSVRLAMANGVVLARLHWRHGKWDGIQNPSCLARTGLGLTRVTLAQYCVHPLLLINAPLFVFLAMLVPESGPSPYWVPFHLYPPPIFFFISRLWIGPARHTGVDSLIAHFHYIPYFLLFIRLYLKFDLFYCIYFIFVLIR